MIRIEILGKICNDSIALVSKNFYKFFPLSPTIVFNNHFPYH